LTTATTGHAECGEPGAVEFVAGVYQKQAELHAASTPLDADDFHAMFARNLRTLMQTPRSDLRSTPDGPILNAFFGWGVLPKLPLTVDKVVQVSGRDEGPATIRVDLRYRGEMHQVLVRAVREKDIWRIANISYESGNSLVEHYRRLTER
jgi:hypothetical protein